MRIVYIDIDTLRADHLGCYGYHRNTSPNIDALARTGVVFEQVYASDTPCLPSRSALLTMQLGIRNGIVNHGGTDADPVIEGAGREFQSRLYYTSLPRRLQMAGLRTVSISSFAQRHSAFHWYAGFSESYDVGKFGFETADEVHAIAAIGSAGGAGRTTGFCTCISGIRTHRTGRLRATANRLPTMHHRNG